MVNRARDGNYESSLQREEVFAEISRVMGKTRVSVRSKMYHLGLSVVDATGVQRAVAATIASTTSPAEHTAGPLTASTPVQVVGAAKDKVASGCINCLNARLSDQGFAPLELDAQSYRAQVPIIAPLARCDL